MRMIQQALPSAAFGKVADVRDSEVRAIVCSDGKPSRSFLQALRRSGIGPRSRSVRIGVSSEATDPTSLPGLLHEAHLAVEFTTPAQPLMHFADIDLTEFLIRRPDKDAFRLIPKWAPKLSNGMAQTVRAFADCSLNVKQTARQLGVHPNTVYFRLNQIAKLTGVNPRTFRGTALLVSALRLIKS
jgi:sugar diacid utilization regulator